MASTWLDTVNSLTQGVVTPLIQKEILGKDAATELALAREQNYYNQLNGSGAPDPQAVVDNASRGTELNTPSKFAWGDPFAFIARNRMLAFLLLGTLALVAFYFFKKR